MLTIHNLHISLGSKPILKGVSLNLKPGEFLAISGVNGAGKSTLLKAITDLLPRDQGEISWNFSPKHIGWIPQLLHLSQPCSALQNVLSGALKKYPFLKTALCFPENERKTALQLLRDLGLGEKTHLPSGTLSGGEQQRVAIARALISESSLLLADEPVAHQDDLWSRKLLPILKERTCQRQGAVICVIHDLRLIHGIADRVLILKNGVLECAP